MRCFWDAAMLFVLGFTLSLVATACGLFAIICVAFVCTLVYGLSKLIATAMASCC